MEKMHNTQSFDRASDDIRRDVYTPKDFIADPALEGTTREISVLFVDDNIIVGTSVVHALIDLGYAVRWLQDGETALEVILKQYTKFDIMVSDVVMSGMSGICLARKVRGLFPYFPVLLASGYSEQIAHISEIDYDFINKPYRIDDLVYRMGKCADDMISRYHLLSTCANRKDHSSFH